MRAILYFAVYLWTFSVFGEEPGGNNFKGIFPPPPWEEKEIQAQDERTRWRETLRLGQGNVYVFLGIDLSVRGEDAQTQQGLRDKAAQDLANYTQLFRDVFSPSPDPQSPNPMAGRGRIITLGSPGILLTPEAVTKVLRGYDRFLKGGDTVLFLYVGHGGFHTERRHLLQMSGGEMPRNRLRQLLVDTGAGNVILMTNACSNFINLPHELELGEGAALGGDNRNLVLEDLLLRSKGITDITAASEGQYAWSGIFSESFLSVANGDWAELDVNGDGYVSWPEAFAAISRAQDLRYEQLKQSRRAKPDFEDMTGQNLRNYGLGVARNPGERPVRVVDERPGKVNPNAPAEVNSVRLLKGWEKGRRGFWFDIDCNVRFHRGQRVLLLVVFYQPDGVTQLRDKNHSYRTPGGNVGTWMWLKPGFPDAHYGEKVFIPYRELDFPARGRHNFSYVVYVKDAQNKVLGQSRPHRGWVSN